MLAENLISTQAYVFNRKAWHEYDLRLLCFTEKLGLANIMAFGAASHRSSRGRLCQPFQLLDMQLESKLNKQLTTQPLRQYQLVETELLEISLDAVPNQLLLGCGYYLNECFKQLHAYLDIDTQAISLLQRYYQQLARAHNQQLALVLRQFELDLFKLIGYDLITLSKRLAIKHNWAYFQIDQGWQVASQPNHWSLNASQLDLLTRIDSKASSQQVFSEGGYSKADWAQLKRHNQQVLAQLGYQFQSNQWLQAKTH